MNNPDPATFMNEKTTRNNKADKQQVADNCELCQEVVYVPVHGLFFTRFEIDLEVVGSGRNLYDDVSFQKIRDLFANFPDGQ